MNKLVGIIVLAATFSGCTHIEKPLEEAMYFHNFDSYADFKSTLNTIVMIDDPNERDNTLSIFWDSLKSNNQIPFVFGDSVMFLHQGDAISVSWAGDFNGWRPSKGKQLNETDVWFLEKTFPLDARLDYKIVDDDKWILDLNNPFIQYSGWGPNSELRMPDWVYPEETVRSEGVRRGVLSENTIISASVNTLNYKLQYKVYTPFDYDILSNLPVVYVTDGHEYSDDRLGSMIIILDNLIQNKVIPPVLAVFLDPRNPEDLGENKRQEQYTGNQKFADFVADELVVEIDYNYKTSNNANDRAILGTSLGGWNSGYFGVSRSDKFHLIGIHSPAFDSNVIDAYANSETLPLKIFMSTGVIYDTQDKARAMKAVFDEKEYELNYVEVNEGHSWGNWRALIQEPLVYFFSK